MTKENRIQFWVEKCNEFSISLFAARKEINNLRRMIAIDFEVIEKLVAEKNALSEKVRRLEVVRPVQKIPGKAEDNEFIVKWKNWLFSTQASECIKNNN